MELLDLLQRNRGHDGAEKPLRHLRDRVIGAVGHHRGGRGRRFDDGEHVGHCGNRIGHFSVGGWDSDQRAISPERSLTAGAANKATRGLAFPRGSYILLINHCCSIYRVDGVC